MPKNDHLLTASQAAERVGMNLRTFQRHVGLGNIPYAQKLPGLRGAYLFDPEALDRFETSREGVAS